MVAEGKLFCLAQAPLHQLSECIFAVLEFDFLFTMNSAEESEKFFGKVETKVFLSSKFKSQHKWDSDSFELVVITNRCFAIDAYSRQTSNRHGDA